MFKIIKIDFYDQFKCITSDCPDNCCDNEWNITIDEKTYELYKTAFGADIDAVISPMVPHVIIKHNGNCPFITEEGLCILHKNLGEQFLSNTCRYYPRFASTYGDTYLETLGMSCPAVARMVVDYDKYILFEEKVHYEVKSELGEKFRRLPIEKAARDYISLFVTGKGKKSIYEDIYQKVSQGKGMPDIDLHGVIEYLNKIFMDNSASKYLTVLFGEKYDEYIKDNRKLFETELILESEYPWFASNFNRIFFFEHFMLESLKEDPLYTCVVLEGAIAWMLFLVAISAVKQQAGVISEDDVINCTYKLMRVIDHDENVLRSIVTASYIG